MKVLPAFFRGAYKSSLLLALQETVSGIEIQNQFSCGSQEGGSFSCCFPEFCCSVLHKVAKCPKTSFLIVFKNLRTESGLISWACVGKCSKCSGRKGRTRVDNVEKRVERAEALMGEISAARHALEGSPVAPGNEDTLNTLRDEDRRPAVPRDPIPEEILRAVPARPFELDKSEFLHCLRTAQQEGLPAGGQNICVLSLSWTTMKIATCSTKLLNFSPKPAFPKTFSQHCEWSR